MNPVERQSAAKRRQAVLDAAVEEIAVSGFTGATTAAIAKRAGISQPYVFRFFPTKKDLALAVIDRCAGRVLAAWETAVPLPGETRLDTLGRTYVEEIVPRRVDILGQLQAYAAAEDPDVAEVMRHHIARIYRYVVAALERDGHPGAYEQAAGFMGRGLFITGSMAIGLESVLSPEEWAGICGKKDVARIEDRVRTPAA